MSRAKRNSKHTCEQPPPTSLDYGSIKALRSPQSVASRFETLCDVLSIYWLTLNVFHAVLDDKALLRIRFIRPSKPELSAASRCSCWTSILGPGAMLLLVLTSAFTLRKSSSCLMISVIVVESRFTYIAHDQPIIRTPACAILIKADWPILSKLEDWNQSLALPQHCANHRRTCLQFLAFMHFDRLGNCFGSRERMH
ncbi:hypothetical protein F4777DRAFT_139476 [Nemania sp. FL0916]|nr:hypothetical protein F4777DRAFT_139476 [Nemania sp. FL0916]